MLALAGQGVLADGLGDFCPLVYGVARGLWTLVIAMRAAFAMRVACLSGENTAADAAFVCELNRSDLTVYPV